MRFENFAYVQMRFDRTKHGGRKKKAVNNNVLLDNTRRKKKARKKARDRLCKRKKKSSPEEPEGWRVIIPCITPSLMYGKEAGFH